MPGQFTLRTLFVAVSIVAGYCALYVASPGFFWFLGVPAAAGGLTYLSRRLGADVGLGEAVVVGLIVLVLVGLLMPAVQSSGGGRSRRATCLNNLHQISIALQNYHGARGSYPPAYVADAQGKPLESWRVLILPYLEHRQLYDEWKLHSDEPWNGPNNIKLSQQVPEMLHCPSDTGPVSDTSYVAIVGPGTIWPGTGKVKYSDITDGASNTVIVVEVSNSGINWMEPRDLDSVNRAPGINSKAGLGVRSGHPAVACMLYTDGRSTFVDETLSEEQLQALLTIAGGETIRLP